MVGDKAAICAGGWWTAHHAWRPAWRRQKGRGWGGSMLGVGPENQSESVDTPPPHPRPTPGSSPRPAWITAPQGFLPKPGLHWTTRPPGLCALTPTAGLREEKGGGVAPPACPSPFLSFLPLDWKPPQESKETCSAPALGVKSRDFPSKDFASEAVLCWGIWSPRR